MPATASLAAWPAAHLASCSQADRLDGGDGVPQIEKCHIVGEGAWQAIALVGHCNYAAVLHKTHTKTINSPASTQHLL